MSKDFETIAKGITLFDIIKRSVHTTDYFPEYQEFVLNGVLNTNNKWCKGQIVRGIRELIGDDARKAIQ